ncbi:hypothetical protein BJ546DRAFT_165725 [Cryomyces antarcticus]
MLSCSRTRSASFASCPLRVVGVGRSLCFRAWHAYVGVGWVGDQRAFGFLQPVSLGLHWKRLRTLGLNDDVWYVATALGGVSLGATSGCYTYMPARRSWHSASSNTRSHIYIHATSRTTHVSPKIIRRPQLFPPPLQDSPPPPPARSDDGMGRVGLE